MSKQGTQAESVAKFCRFCLDGDKTFRYHLAVSIKLPAAPPGTALPVALPIREPHRSVLFYGPFPPVCLFAMVSPSATLALWVLLVAAAPGLLVGCTAEERSAEASALSEQPDTLMTEPNTLTAEERDEGWQLLFDGDSLSDHWRGFKREDVPAAWRAEDGTLMFDPEAGDGGDLITKQEYDDYELKLDWKISEGGNSGIIYNVSEEYDATWESGPEMQILDDERHPDREDPTHRAGSNYDLDQATPGVVKPAGEWNEVRIVMDGNHVEHWLNGQKVVEYELGSDEWKEKVAASKFSEMPGYGQADAGHIALQDHGDVVWYRNLKIRPLTGEESAGSE